MTNTGRYHGGLVISGYDESMLDRTTRIVAATLDDYGHPVERQSIVTLQDSRITASHYMIRLSVRQGSPKIPNPPLEETCAVSGLMPKTAHAGPEETYVKIDLVAADPARDDAEISELLLVMVLYRMVDAFDVSLIEWLDYKPPLSPELFLSAFSHLPAEVLRGNQQIMDVNDPRFDELAVSDMPRARPHRTGGRIKTAGLTGQQPYLGKIGLIDMTEEESLAIALREDPHPCELQAAALEAEMEINSGSDIRRLASWGMTGVTAFMCAPVAVSLAAINLAKGEDFRLNTHALTLTGLVVTLQSSGALASAVAHLPL